MKYKQRLVLSVLGILICLLLFPARLLLFGLDEKEEQLHGGTRGHVTTHVVTTEETSAHLTAISKSPRIDVATDSRIASSQSFVENFTAVWKIWPDWVKPNQLYPREKFHSFKMDSILTALATYPVTLFDVGYRGTQLKASMHLEGNQRTVFKPKRYDRDTIVDGPDDPYRGFDRHNGEIASFHLEGILGYCLAPPVVGRKINLTLLSPVTSKSLYKTYFKEDGNTCFYGKCLYCKPKERACAEGEIMEGSVTIWLPEWYKLKTWRHPYQRTYIPGRKARWEIDGDYCRHYLLQTTSEYYDIMPDVLDTAVMDFLIGNADRHHFETYEPDGSRGRLMHIDNGKSFGNPHHDELSILTPLKQCCKLRNSTLLRLKTLKSRGLSKVLDKSLRRDPLYPILTQAHLDAIDRRLDIIIELVNDCIKQNGASNVLFNTWSS